jgi:hypothetical protein
MATTSSSTTTTTMPSLSSVNTTSDTSDLAESSANELTAAVDDLLTTLRAKFASATTDMLAKMDDMSRRLDSLEQTLRMGESEDGRTEGKGEV